MSQRKVDIKTGIEIWDGLPGSGKSYSSVEELIRIIVEERRPVYTNLPLKMRVLKKLLVIRTVNKATANYIQYLDQDHFTRFVQRNEVWTNFREPLKAQGYGNGYIARMFEEVAGQHQITGPDANWIPAGAVLILDEFHRWADQRMQKAEDPAFMLYATMHRHHMHRVIIATQNAMQVSITWRRNSDELVHHTDKRKLPFIWGMRLPIPAFAREYWPKEYIEESRVGQKPTKTEVFIPAISGGLIWRCYDSFTHMGGIRRLNRALTQTRQQVEGDDYKKIEQQGDSNVSIKKSPIKIIGGIVKFCMMICLVIGLLFWIHNIQSTSAKQAKQTASTMAALNTQIAQVSMQLHEMQTATPGQPAYYQQQKQPPKVSMITDEYCMANGRICRIGDEIDGYLLEKVNYENGSTIWSLGDARFNVPLERVLPAVEPINNPTPRPTDQGHPRSRPAGGLGRALGIDRVGQLGKQD